MGLALKKLEIAHNAGFGTFKTSIMFCAPVNREVAIG